MLEKAVSAVTVIFSTRRGELAELIKNANGDNSSTSTSTNPGVGSDEATEPRVDDGGANRGNPAGESRLGSLDGFDGIVVVGGDGTFFEVWCVLARPFFAGCCDHLLAGSWWFKRGCLVLGKVGAREVCISGVMRTKAGVEM